MRHVQATAVVLLCAVLGAAAPPKPAAEKVTVSVGELSRVEVTPDAAGVVGWASGAGDADLFVDELAPRGGKTRLLVQAKKAGTYRVILWTKGETDSTFVEIVAGGGSPPVVDPVKPDPKPEPVKVDKVAVVVVEESQARTVAQAKALAELEVWCKQNGHSRWVVDKDDPTASKNGYLPLVKKLPGVIVFDKAGGGTPLTVFDLDNDPVSKVKEVVK